MAADPTVSVSWLDAYTLAAQRTLKLPENWIGYLFVARPGQGIDVTGVIVTAAISRGPRKGEPNFRTANPATKRTVFVSTEAAETAHADLARRIAGC